MCKCLVFISLLSLSLSLSFVNIKLNISFLNRLCLCLLGPGMICLVCWGGDLAMRTRIWRRSSTTSRWRRWCWWIGGRSRPIWRRRISNPVRSPRPPRRPRLRLRRRRRLRRTRARNDHAQRAQQMRYRERGRTCWRSRKKRLAWRHEVWGSQGEEVEVEAKGRSSRRARHDNDTRSLPEARGEKGIGAQNNNKRRKTKRTRQQPKATMSPKEERFTHSLKEKNKNKIL